MTTKRCYDIHGLAGIEIYGKDEYIDEFDRELRFFRASQCNPFITLNVCEPLPENIKLTGASPLGDELFYDVNEGKTIILRDPKPIFSEKDVMFVILGDMRSSSKITVYVPNGTWGPNARWKNLAHNLLRSDSVNVTFEEVTGILARIGDPCLYYYLPSLGYSFLHAGAVFKEKGVLFFGPSNIGKTSIVLEMVKRGWEFLGDDTIIIDQRNHALAYPKTIKLEGQNIATHPYLYNSLSSKMGTLDRFFLRRSMRAAANKPFKIALHAYILDLFTDAKVRNECNVDFIVRLTRSPQDKPTVQEIDLNSCVNSLSVGLFWEFYAQRWRHSEYRYCSAFPTGRDFILEEARHNEKVTDIISKCISRSKAFELRMPYNYSKIDDAVDTLLAKL
jgi:hypothetical protein